jgi:ABC-2 type transport system ATP-binding protein
MAALELRAVTKSFADVRAVSGVTFSARAGALTALLGRNGSGKTTTLRMITGLLSPDSGQIRLWGGEPSRPEIRDRIGYLPEERGLYESMRVREQVEYFAALKSCRGARARLAVESWLRRLELWTMRDARLVELSKGNRQKVQLACALAHDPDLVVLDEPMSGLDVLGGELVMRALEDLRDAGKIVVVSTHRMDLAERLAEDVVLIERGRVVRSGGIDDVLRDGGDSLEAVFRRDVARAQEASP